MPFKSEAQRRFLWFKHPRIARRWANEEKSGDYHNAARRRIKKGRYRRQENDES